MKNKEFDNKGFDLVIKAGSSNRNYFKDLWRFNELLYFLAWRDILVRYKQTLIGITWGVIRPLLTIIFFTIIFGKVAKLPQYDIPYPLLVLSGMLPWYFFSNALSDSSSSLISNSNLLTKVYFPRMLIPISSISVSFIDFGISLGLLAIMMLWYQFVPGIELLAIPIFILIALIAALGAGLWMSALNIRYRDFRYIIPFLMQFGILISPVGYTSEIISEEWRLVYSLNPLAGIIDGFRWSLLGGYVDLFIPGLIISFTVTILIFVSGVYYFRKTERVFADII